jgi:phospholipase/carboxylesterase
MFRRCLFPFPQKTLQVPTFSLTGALKCAPSGDSAYSLFVPLHYERGYAYPLLVWLHGPGSNERQLPEIMRQISIRNYVAVAPRGNRLPEDFSGGESGFGWLQTEEAIQEAEQRVFEIIDLASRRYHFSKRRIFLAGYESGGTMAMRLALRHPNSFAGAASFGGPMPGGNNPLGNLAAARKLNFLILCGRSSTAYSPQDVCDNLRLFHAAGIPVSLRQYPCGQELAPAMLADLNRWIIEQVTGDSASSLPAVDPEWSSKTE